jgi:hypothetical protein
MRQSNLILNGLFLLLLLLLGSCQDNHNPEKNTQDKTEGIATKKTDFTGFDMNGNQRSCAPMDPNIACTMMMAPSDFYGMKCKEMGLKAYQCGCHDWLCEKPIAFENGAETK